MFGLFKGNKLQKRVKQVCARANNGEKVVMTAESEKQTLEIMNMVWQESPLVQHVNYAIFGGGSVLVILEENE